MEQQALTESALIKVHSGKSFWKKVFSFFGPAFLISVGYMDPGNWATDIAAGSAFGYRLIWVLFASNAMALILQYLSIKLGVVGRLDLAQACRQEYPRAVNFFLYLAAEIAIIACDLAEVIGMAIGLNLLFGLPLVIGVLLTALDTLLIFALMKGGARQLEAFILGLVAIIGFSFLIQMFLVKPSGTAILQGFIPSALNSQAIYFAIGIIGATVMPHNLYLHSSLVQSRRLNPGLKGTRQALRFNMLDTGVALNLAFFVNAAILVLAAAAFFKHGFHKVEGIAEAHTLLQNLLGNWAPRLFAIALIAAGQSSTITGTLAGQIIMEGHLAIKLKPWVRRLLTRSLAIVPAVACILYYGENSLGNLLVFSQVILSLQLGFAVIPLLHFTSERRLMGLNRNGIWVKVFGWMSAALILSLNLQYVLSTFRSMAQAQKTPPSVLYGLLFPACLAAAGVLSYLILSPLYQFVLGKRKLQALRNGN